MSQNMETFNLLRSAVVSPLSIEARSSDSKYENGDPHLSVAGMTAVIWIETAFAILFVAFRTVIRLKTMKKLLVDDYLVYAACLFLIAMTALYTPSVPIIYNLIELAEGKAPEGFVLKVELYLKLQFAMIILFWACIWAVKFAFLVFYKQLLKGTQHKGTIIAWWIVLLICAGTFIGCVITQFLSCDPLPSYFLIGPAGCVTAHDYYVSNMSLYYSAATDIACDLLIMALPLSILRKLQTNRPRKIALAGVFTVGFIIIIFAILRVVKTHPSTAHVNPKWLCVLSVTEASVAVMVSSTPALRSLFVKVAEKSGSLKSTKAKKSNGFSIELSDRSSSTVPLSSSAAKSAVSKSNGTDSPDLDLAIYSAYEAV